MLNPSELSTLARSVLAGDQTPDAIIERLTRALGRPWRWLAPLATRYVRAFTGHTRARHRGVVRFLIRDRGLQRAATKYRDDLSIAHWPVESQPMQPVAAAAGWDLPIIETVADLANWLWLDYRELDWFADLKALGYKSERGRLRHYHYRILPKSGRTVRLIEAPKQRLKRIQREILSGILEHVPPHSAAHGFVKGRSIRTFIACHTARRVVLRMDLRNFFPGLGLARIQTIFRTLGYPEPVADLLGGLCTNSVPLDVWEANSLDISCQELHETRALYARRHLPQGAPTSPALANICAYRLDCRLTGLARSAEAHYTRYADDLAFSGDRSFEKVVERFSTSVAAILLEEGFEPNYRKTRIMRQGVRQNLAGLVANERPNIVRADFDCLKATLANCARYGPESQNRTAHPAFRSHLEGKIAFVAMINPGKAERLRRTFDRIQW